MKIKITTINRIFLLWMVFVITSCDDSSDSNTKKEQTLKTKRDAEVVSIYNSFLYEKKLCNKFVKAIGEDPEFMKLFGHSDFRERNLYAMLSGSKIAGTDVVQYVLNHIDYFDIDVDIHGGPGMTYAENSCIYCAITDKRLKEIEAISSSEHAWKMRKYFLNLSLESLLDFGMPGFEGPITYDFENLAAEVESAKKKYLPEFEPVLRQWVDRASVRLREDVENSDDEYMFMEKKQRVAMVEKWIADLKSGFK